MSARAFHLKWNLMRIHVLHLQHSFLVAINPEYSGQYTFLTYADFPIKKMSVLAFHLKPEAYKDIFITLFLARYIS